MSETADEFITAGWLLGAPMVWAGKKAYRGAQRAGMRFQNWRWGAAGDNPRRDDPYSKIAGFAPSAGEKWTSIETTETTSYYHHRSTKWTREGQGKE